MTTKLTDLASLHRAGTPRGIASICSAHPTVLRATLRHGRETSSSVLIEATCNQVNHQGGYTGMQPAEFVDLVMKIAVEEDCPRELIVLGGDHLGPNPWTSLAAEAAMTEAEKMMAAFVAAGFRKIHLDASMGCQGEPVALDDDTTAVRAARLARVAEDTARETGGDMPVYIIGTEVPPPGGADHVLTSVDPTPPERAKHTIDVHRRVFAETGLDAAFDRVIGLVVQPGVEFGNHNVAFYDQAKARELVKVLDDQPQFVLEAHSTDYQGRAPLTELVEDGFAILKVGPELTFVLREALYGLDRIASALVDGYPDRLLRNEMEALMLDQPGHWHRHYPGRPEEQENLRHNSLSDRIRYYWATPRAQAAVDRLFAALKGQKVPTGLIEVELPGAVGFAGAPLEPEEVLIARITAVLKAYNAACHPHAVETWGKISAASTGRKG